MKITLTSFILFLLFTVNTVAQDFTHTVFEFGLEDDPWTIGDVYSVAFSPDGKTLASAGKYYIRLWDVETATHKAIFNPRSSVNSVAFSPDGKILATGGQDAKIHLWDVDAGTYKATFDHGSSVNSVAFSPDGKTLATGGGYFRGGFRIHLWDMDTATHKAAFDRDGSSINSVAFSPDGKTLATGGQDAKIHLWDVETATHKTTFIQIAIIHFGIRRASSVYSVAFSPDGKTLATGGFETIQLWDMDTTTHKATFSYGDGEEVNSVAFSPDGKTLAGGSENKGLHLWDVDAATRKTGLGYRTVHSVAFSPDGKTLASAGGPSIGLWDVDARQITITLPVRDRIPINSVAFSSDGKTLATGGEDPRIHLWDVDTSTHKTTLGRHVGPVNSIAFSPDGKTLAAGGEDSTIRLWDMDTSTHKTTLGRHVGPVNSIAFSPDGKTLAAGGEDPIICLWDVDTATRKATLEIHVGPVNSVAFSPDGKTLASAGRGDSIRLWDVNTATHKTTLSGGGHRGPVYSVVFSPDGKILASAGEDRKIHLWDVNTATHKTTLEIHEGPVHSVAFSPDGKTLASAGYASDARTGRIATIRLWKFPATHLNVTPYPVVPPAIGEQFIVNLSIIDGEDVGGYQFTVGYDETILRYVESANGDYLPPGSFFVPPVVSKDAVTLSATSLTGTSNGDGTLATVTFEVLKIKESAIALSDVILTDGTSKPFSVLTYSSRVEPTLLSSPTVVDLTPPSVMSPSIGERLAFNIGISDGQNVAGYQVSLEYDINALKPVLASNGLYLPDASPAKPLISEGVVTLGASSVPGVGNGDGILATITFEVLAVQASTVSISGYLTTPNGLRSTPTFKGANVIVALLGDVNRDGSVDLQDLAIVSEHLGQKGQNSADVNEDGVVDAVDLALVADAIKNNAAAPSLQPEVSELFTAEDVKLWLAQAQHLDLTDVRFQRGILFFQQLLTVLIPKETALLANYPNPFNPETWIPYQITKDADVVLTIYAVNGQLIRTLALGHQPAGIYQNRSRAAYWDGRNEVGESVASGVYFYTLRAGDFSATRKMLIRK